MDRKIVYVGIDTLFQALPALVKAGCRVCEIVSCPVDNETEFNLRTCAFAGDNQIPLLIGRIMREDVERWKRAGIDALICCGYYYRIPLDENSNDVTAFLAKQAVKATSKLNIRAIITDSFSGRTARNIAAFRGKYPVLAICYKEKTMRHLALSYGVEAIYMPEKANGQAYYFAALRKLLDDGVLSESDMVAYLSSGKQGTQTSFLEINVVGDVLKYAMDYVLPNRNRYL